MIKLIITESKVPMPSITAGAVSVITPSTISVTAGLRTISHLVRSMPPVSKPIKGMMMLSTREVVILPNAPPMTTPMAMSITLPRMAKSLNSFRNFFIFISP